MDWGHILLLSLYWVRAAIGGLDLYASVLYFISGNIVSAILYLLLGIGFTYWAYWEYKRYRSRRRKELIRDLVSDGYDWD